MYYIQTARSTVLILVLVEDGLGASFIFSIGSRTLVLILVLVEDGLGVSVTSLIQVYIDMS